MMKMDAARAVNTAINFLVNIIKLISFRSLHIELMIKIDGFLFILGQGQCEYLLKAF